MKPFYIYLDDLREKPGYYDRQFRCYDDFVNYIMSIGDCVGDLHISFDHDLGEGKNGYDCAKWLVNWCMENGYDVPSYSIHSANPVGAENIKSIFDSYEKVKKGGDVIDEIKNAVEKKMNEIKPLSHSVDCDFEYGKIAAYRTVLNILNDFKKKKNE